MSTQNIGFHEEIGEKIVYGYPHLSGAMINI